MQAHEFEMAVYHLERGQALLEEQRARIARLQARGNVPRTATQFLIQLEQAVSAFEHHLRILEAELAEEMSQEPQAVS